MKIIELTTRSFDKEISIVALLIKIFLQLKNIEKLFLNSGDWSRFILVMCLH
jgi:hypothetical protein